MSAEGFEKTRIQNPDEAHEMANMQSVSMESGEAPTAQDYDNALSELEKLQKEAREEISTVHKVTKPLRNVWAGMIAGGGASMELLALALVAAGTTVGPYPKHMSERSRRELVERFERIGDDYERTKEFFSSAGERLEEWKAEAEELAKKQLEQK